MILRRIRRSWLRRALRILRWSRFCAYLTISLAGVASIAIPPASIRAATGGELILLLSWSALMSVSALFCAWGAAADRWVGEYVGLIPLSAVAIAYGVSAMTRGSVGWSGGLFLIGFFWLLMTRWQEVALLRVEAIRQATRTEPANDGDQG